MTFLERKMPETSNAFVQMSSSILNNGALDLKTKELIAVASSVLMRCEKCVEVHSQRALSNGSTENELVEAISVVMLIAGGSQIGWTEIYDKIFEQDTSIQTINANPCCGEDEKDQDNKDEQKDKPCC